MKPCMSQVTTLSTPFEADVSAYARAGWPGLELWLTKLETFLERQPVAAAKKLLADEGLIAAGAAAQGGLLRSTGREEHWELFRRRLDILAELGVGTLVITADFEGEPRSADYSRAAEALAVAAERAKRTGIRLALEFQKPSRLCASLDTALALIAQVGAEDLGVCLDLFHYYTGPSKFEDLAYLSRANLAWVQVCDLAGTPRELAGDADRILPGDGDFQIGPILGQLARLGYDGWVSVEVLDPQLWTIAADRVADAASGALRRVLDGLDPATDARGGP